jgi:hypothetical protein
MNPFIRVIEALNRNDVRYVVVGGFAAMLHGNNRATVDLDLVVDLDANEVRKVIRVLQSLGLTSRLPVDPLQFADAETRQSWVREKQMIVFTMTDPTHPTFVVDLFAENPIDFATLYQRGLTMTLQGQPLRVCSIDDLIDMKTRSGRPRDLLDVKALRALQSRKGNGCAP